MLQEFCVPSWTTNRAHTQRMAYNRGDPSTIPWRYRGPADDGEYGYNDSRRLTEEYCWARDRGSAWSLRVTVVATMP
jgi:hypothetical protein